MMFGRSRSVDSEFHRITLPNRHRPVTARRPHEASRDRGVADPRVALALPRLRSALERHAGLGSAAPVLPGMQWLASRAHRAAASPGDWRAWLLSRVGPGADVLQRCPAGPAVRALATGAREAGLLGLRTTGAPAHRSRSPAPRAAGRSSAVDRRGTSDRRLARRGTCRQRLLAATFRSGAMDARVPDRHPMRHRGACARRGSRHPRLPACGARWRADTQADERAADAAARTSGQHEAGASAG